MPSLIFFFIALSLPVTFAASRGEGLVAFKANQVFIEKGLNASTPIPTSAACDTQAFKGFDGHYIDLEWDMASSKDCFTVISMKRILYDPLRGTLKPFRKK